MEKYGTASIQKWQMVVGVWVILEFQVIIFLQLKTFMCGVTIQEWTGLVNHIIKGF